MDKWAIVIGIDKFQNPKIPELQYASKDAGDFSKFLVEKGNFARDHVLLLTNEHATHESIKDAIGDSWLPRRASADDLVVLFASTHGSPKEIDVAGENFLVAYDTDPAKLFTTGIKFADLAPTIKQRTGCDRIVLLLDACNSGAANVGGKGLARTGNFDVNALAGEGQIVISSSSADQRSFESKRYENGVFTKQLIASLQSEGPNTTLTAAFQDLKEQVENEVRFDRKQTQTPVMRSKWVGGELILIAVPAHPRSVPGEPVEPAAAEALSNPDDIFNKGKKLVEAHRYDEAARVLQEAVQSGHPKAQVWLADLYRQGKGVKQSYSRAAELYQKAADQGNAAAKFYLGWMSATGNGLPQSFSKAAEWYQQSAEQGEPAAQCNLGALYAAGDGVPQNLYRSAEWYQKAADRGNVHAQYDLAGLYSSGKGVEKNLSKAVEWYQKAADSGFALAQLNLGLMLEHGDGVPQSESRAAEWYLKAAAQGDKSAQYQIGSMYERGCGVTQDLSQAINWFRKSAAQGDDRAIQRIKYLEHR